MPLLQKLTLNQMKDMFLTEAGWHHTGKFYNETNFYRIDDDFIINVLDNNIINTKIEHHKKWLEDTREERKKKRLEQEANYKEKEYKKYILDFRKVTKYKRDSSLWKAFKNGKITEDELLEMKKKAIENRRKELENSWKNDPNASYQYKRINDEYIWKYIH